MPEETESKTQEPQTPQIVSSNLLGKILLKDGVTTKKVSVVSEFRWRNMLCFTHKRTHRKREIWEVTHARTGIGLTLGCAREPLAIEEAKDCLRRRYRELKGYSPI